MTYVPENGEYPPTRCDIGIAAPDAVITAAAVLYQAADSQLAGIPDCEWSIRLAPGDRVERPEVQVEVSYQDTRWRYMLTTMGARNFGSRAEMERFCLRGLRQMKARMLIGDVIQFTEADA